MVDFVGCIFADEVRNEDNGKLLLIGVYTGEISIQQFPTVARITPILVISNADNLNTVHISISTESGSLDLGAEAEVEIDPEVNAPSQTLMPLPQINLKLEKPDMIIVKAGSSEENQRFVGSINIIGPKSPTQVQD